MRKWVYYNMLKWVHICTWKWLQPCTQNEYIFTWTHTHKHTYIDRQTGRHTERHKNRQKDRQTVTHIDRQADSPTILLDSFIFLFFCSPWLMLKDQTGFYFLCVVLFACNWKQVRRPRSIAQTNGQCCSF